MPGERARRGRRHRRELEQGPERAIERTACGAHLLSCGHQVLVLPGERENLRWRRCLRCLPQFQRLRDRIAEAVQLETTREDINRMFSHLNEDGMPWCCEACGATRSIVPVKDVPGVLGECRECHELVGPALEDPGRLELIRMEYEKERSEKS